MTTSSLGLILLAGAAVVLAAIVSARVAYGIGLPGLLVFLGLGLALGEAGIGVRFDNAGLAEMLGAQRAGADPGRGRADHQLGARPRRGSGRA